MQIQGPKIMFSLKKLINNTFELYYTLKIYILKINLGWQNPSKSLKIPLSRSPLPQSEATTQYYTISPFFFPP